MALDDFPGAESTEASLYRAWRVHVAGVWTHEVTEGVWEGEQGSHLRALYITLGLRPNVSGCSVKCIKQRCGEVGRLQDGPAIPRSHDVHTLVPSPPFECGLDLANCF